jgi:anti-anti-sigma factor
MRMRGRPSTFVALEDVVPAASLDLSHPFSIAVVPERAEVVVIPIGELDVSSIDTLEREVHELRDGRFEEVVLDLRQVTFMGSTGLRCLIALRNDAVRRDYRLTLKPGPRQLERLFDLTGTRGLFNWRPALTAAAPFA